MNLLKLLHELEIGHTSAAQAEQQIRDKIEYLKSIDKYDDRWRKAIDQLKIALGLAEIKK